MFVADTSAGNAFTLVDIVTPTQGPKRTGFELQFASLRWTNIWRIPARLADFAWNAR
jgi:hypothetical protein